MFIDKFACFEEDKSASQFCDANLHKIFESNTDEQACPHFLLSGGGYSQIDAGGPWALPENLNYGIPVFLHGNCNFLNRFSIF